MYVGVFLRLMILDVSKLDAFLHSFLETVLRQSADTDHVHTSLHFFFFYKYRFTMATWNIVFVCFTFCSAVSVL